MTLPFCLIRDQKHQDKCQSRTWCIYLLLLVAILLSGCQADNGWQKNTLARVQKVSTAGWDEFSARRLPKLLSTIQNNPEKARLAWLQLAPAQIAEYHSEQPGKSTACLVATGPAVANP